jgi:WD40 repeat protein
MNSLRVKFSFIFILVWLVACRSNGSTQQSPAATGELLSPVLNGQNTPDQVETSTQTEIQPTHTPTINPEDRWTPTITSTGFITTPIVPTTTAALTPGELTATTTVPALTLTPGITQSMVITTTTLLTNTWTYTDVLVTTSGAIRQIAWKQDGALFAVATSVGMFLYNAETLEIERSINIGETVQSVAFSPVENLLAAGSLKGDIQWWFPDTGRYAGSFKGGRLGVNSLSFSAQEDVMASGSDDGTIRVWNPSQLLDPGIVEYQPLNTWQAVDRITSVNINQDAQLAAAGSYQTVSVWDLGTGELLQTLDDFKGWVRDIAFSPDGGALAVADSSNRLRLWETASWKLTHDIPLEVFDSITGIDFNRDGMRLALGGKNGRVLLWNVPSNALFDPVTTYSYPVTDIRFHPYENSLISSHSDGTLRLWSFQQ